MLVAYMFRKTESYETSPYSGGTQPVCTAASEIHRWLSRELATGGCGGVYPMGENLSEGRVLPAMPTRTELPSKAHSQLGFSLLPEDTGARSSHASIFGHPGGLFAFAEPEARRLRVRHEPDASGVREQEFTDLRRQLSSALKVVSCSTNCLHLVECSCFLLTNW